MRNVFDVCRPLLGSLVCLSALSVVVGCEESPQAQTSVATAPSTQGVVENVVKSTRRVALESTPFTAEIPGEWDVEPNALATANVLRGPKAKDDPEGFLARQGTLDTHEEISLERTQSMIDRFKQQDEKAETDVSVYELGPVTAVEIIHREPSVTTQPTDKVETLIQQTFHIFGPGTDGKKSWSEIRFPHATVSEYEADRETLTKIIKSIQFDASTTQPASTELP